MYQNEGKMEQRRVKCIKIRVKWMKIRVNLILG